MNWPPQWKVLWLGILVSLPGVASANCGLPDGLTEQQQFTFARKMIEDGLLSSARDYLQCYRASKPEGEFRSQAMKLEGDVLVKMGESYWPQAQILLEEWLQQHPQDPEADAVRLQLGKIHYRFDRMQVTEETLARIPASSPQYGAARNLMGQAVFQRFLRYQERGATSQANELAPLVSQYHAEALKGEQDPVQQRQSLYEAGFARYQLGQYTEALPLWDRYLDLAEPSLEREDIRYRVATIHQREQNWLEAEQRYGEYATSKLKIPEESRAQAAFWWGEVAFQRGAEQLKKSGSNGSLDPKFVRQLVPRYEQYLASQDSTYRPLAAFRLGQLYQAIDQPQKATLAYERYLQTKDSAYQQEAHYELGMLAARQNDPKQALVHLEPLKGQEEFRQDPGFWTLLVQQYDALKQGPPAETLLRDASQNNAFDRPTQLRFLQELANRQYQEQRCLDLLRELAPLNDPPNTPETQRLIWLRGSCFLQEQQWELARKDFQPLQNVPEYRESAFRGSVIASQQLQDTPNLQQLYAWGAEQNPALLREEDWQRWVDLLRRQEDWVALQAAYVRWDQSPGATVRQNLGHLLQWAETERRSGNAQTETELLELALYQLPESAEPPREQLVRRLAEIYLERQEPQKIPPLYKVHLLPLLPEDSALYRSYALHLGEIYYLQLQQSDQALLWLTEADSGGETPTDLRAAALRARIQEEQGHPELAIPIWERLAQQQSDPSLRFRGSYQSALHYDQKQEWSEALVRFERVMQTPANTEEEKELQRGAGERIESLRRQVFRDELARLQEAEDWAGVSQWIRKHWEAGEVALDERILRQWVNAQQQRQDWNGLLTLYKDLQRKEPQRPESATDLIWQAEAHEQLQQNREATSFYERALGQLPTEDDRRSAISSRLARLYENGEDHEKQLQLYEQMYAESKDPETKQQFALRAGILSLDKLQNERRAAEWLQRVDTGGTNDMDLRANLLLLDLDLRNQNLDAALRRLQNLEQRNLPESSNWYWPIQHRLGLLHQQRQEWTEAQPYLQRVAAQERFPELQVDARQRLENVDSLLARKQLQEMVEQKRWSEVPAFLEREERLGNLPFDSDIFAIWVRAETEQENWSGVLSLYGRLQKERPEEAQSTEALLNQGQAAENLGGWVRARGYYEQALAQLEPKEEERRLWVIERLRNVYERDPGDSGDEFPPLVGREFDRFQDVERRKQLAGLMLYWARERSQDPQLEREWLVKMGNLNAGDASVQARLRLADLLHEEGNRDQALQVLNPAASSELTPQSTLYVPVHLRLGDWKQDKEQWLEALRHYESVERGQGESLTPEIRDYAQQQVRNLRQYLGTQQLAEALERKDWKQVSNLIAQGITEGSLEPSVDLYRTWIQAEAEQKHWKDVLQGYERLEALEPESVQNLYDAQARGKAAEESKQPQRALTYYSQAYEFAETSEKAAWALFIAERQKDAKERNRWWSLAYEQTSPTDQVALAQRFAEQARQQKDWPSEEFWLRKLDKGGNSEQELQALWRKGEYAKTQKRPQAEMEALQTILQRQPGPDSSWYVLTHYRLGQLQLEAKQNQEAAQSFLLVAQAESPKEYDELRQAARRQWQALQEQGLLEKLIQLEKAKDWAGLSYLIRKEHLAKTLKLDEANFSMLLQAEVNQQNWKGVLRAYQLLEADDPAKAQTPEALLTRARAMAQLQGWEPAAELYQQAWQAQTDKNPKNRLSLLEESRATFENSQQIRSLVTLYEKTCPALKDKADKRRCVETLVYYAQNNLNDEPLARKWMPQLDQGGNSEGDLAALMERARQARDAGDNAKASQLLTQLLQRKPDPNSTYAILAHYQLAVDQQQAEQWDEARKHYAAVVQAKAPTELQEYQQQAKQQLELIDQFLFGARIQQLIEQKKWTAVSQELRPLLEKQGAQASLEWIALWRQAELNQENWKQALATWDLQQKVDPQSAQSSEALWQQGVLWERVGDTNQALELYQALLDQHPTAREAESSVERISTILLQQRKYPELVRFYEKRFETSSDTNVKRAAASQIATYYATVLEKPEEAQKWWGLVDQGGTSPEELEAAFELAKMDGAEGRTAEAIQRLQNLVERPLPPNNQWFVLVHYQLAALYHTQEDFPKALEHYQQVAEHPAIRGLEQYRDLARKTAGEIEAYLAQMQ